MKIFNYLILLFALTFFVNGCSGYKPIFNSTNLNFKISVAFEDQGEIVPILGVIKKKLFSGKF